jgi:hypothetical protein
VDVACTCIYEFSLGSWFDCIASVPERENRGYGFRATLSSDGNGLKVRLHSCDVTDN